MRQEEIEQKDLELYQENKDIALSEGGMLLQLAINKDLDIEKLKELIRLKTEQEERQAKKEFDFHFSEMQKEFTPIEQTKKGYDGYTYAPLSEILKKYSPIISRHGFSFRWRETMTEKNEKRVTIIISGYGHTDDQTSVDIPSIQGTKRQNAIQIRGTMSTYGERYSFKAAFGITEIGEDNNACFNYEDGIFYSDDIQKIRNCSELGKLHLLFKELWHKYGTDKIGQAIISKEKDAKKKELQNVK